jgi:acylphosphatase
MKHYNIKVTGKVQNVGFRYATLQSAQKHNIKGFVQNQHDGSVYIEAEGDDPEINHFLQWCYEGPTWARVENVSVSESNTESYEEFTIR